MGCRRRLEPEYKRVGASHGDAPGADESIAEIGIVAGGGGGPEAASALERRLVLGLLGRWDDASSGAVAVARWRRAAADAARGRVSGTAFLRFNLHVEAQVGVLWVCVGCVGCGVWVWGVGCGVCECRVWGVWCAWWVVGGGGVWGVCWVLVGGLPAWVGWWVGVVDGGVLPPSLGRQDGGVPVCLAAG